MTTVLEVPTEVVKQMEQRARNRVSDSVRRFERLTYKAPGFAGGYLLSPTFFHEETP
ncbi:hypothetical protein [Rhodoferax sp.]|jgi:hypothetical protein|uniref:hypothetical protein n=1 Tax=Rhodoferax sp. TaxID=50421 RepID=UPI003BB6D5BE